MFDSLAAVCRARRLSKNWDLCHQLSFRHRPIHTSALLLTVAGEARTVGRRLGFFDHTGCFGALSAGDVLAAR